MTRLGSPSGLRADYICLQLEEVIEMPIADIEKRRLAQHYILYKRVCRNCGATNPITAKKCRKCKESDLRLKRRSKK